MSKRFDGKVALISGGARGQGLAHARRLCSEGARVYIGDVLIDEGKQAAEDLKSQGCDITFIELDVTDAAHWKNAYNLIEKEVGRLDVLVNNAGIINVTNIEHESLHTWSKILNVNLTGAFLGTQTMIPLLRKSQGSAIVNTSSIFGPSGAIGYSAYSASKAGLLGLTKTAALELAPEGIRVNALVPGGVSTELNAKEPDGGVVPETPMGRRANVDELAAAVAYLASDDASFVTGTELVVDGGFQAR